MAKKIIGVTHIPLWAVDLFTSGDNSSLPDCDERTAIEWYSKLEKKWGKIELRKKGPLAWTSAPAFGPPCEAVMFEIYEDEGGTGVETVT